MAIGRSEVCVFHSSAILNGTQQFHPRVAGIRVSLYNAITEAETDTLVQFMEKFVSEAGTQASV
ncbi:hypothetical protein BC826DRAFT_1039742 [Russula brevipes]|nr:hypothetical protein BC826DRAFT_1039742 [Russula brevipes]